MKEKDTIAAISTPIGKGGIGIVRLSGSEAVNISRKVFSPADGSNISKKPSHTLTYGFVTDGDRKIDEVLVSVMRKPKTYTREDIVEINCHGGIVPLREVLDLVLEKGARPAEPGEFTKRAFLNGRISLDQARWVREVIEAKTSLSLELSVERLEGKFSKQLKKTKEDLTDLLARIDVAIDFPDYEESILEPENITSLLQSKIDEINELTSKGRDGEIFKEGFKIAILGRPNVGKSTLLNTLLDKERAIVTPTPGTTRDTIEEEVEINGLPFTIIDTAGLRDPNSEIEREGIFRTNEQIERADVLLLLLEANKGLEEKDREIAERIPEKKTILLLNKIDLGQKLYRKKIDDTLDKEWSETIKISAKNGEGVKELEEILTDMVWEGQVEKNDEMILLEARERHLLEEARKNLEEGKKALENRLPVDLAEMDIRQARSELGKITGENLTEEVIDRMFANFCVGK